MERLVNFPLTEHIQFLTLIFAGLTVLRRLTIRLEFDLSQCMFSYHPLTMALSTVASPVFCELVIGLGEDCVTRQPWRNWFLWKDTDRVLEEQFSTHEDFQLIIRTGGDPDSVTFERDMREAFQLSANRGGGRIRFEKSHG